MDVWGVFYPAKAECEHQSVGAGAEADLKRMMARAICIDRGGFFGEELPPPRIRLMRREYLSSTIYQRADLFCILEF